MKFKNMSSEAACNALKCGVITSVRYGTEEQHYTWDGKHLRASRDGNSYGTLEKAFDVWSGMYPRWSGW
jgi:hypothetical protein